MNEQEFQRKRIEKRLERIVNEVPGDAGWWTSDAREAYMELGRELLSRGAGLTEIQHQLDRIYTATAGEFGG